MNKIALIGLLIASAILTPTASAAALPLYSAPGQLRPDVDTIQKKIEADEKRLQQIKSKQVSKSLQIKKVATTRDKIYVNGEELKGIFALWQFSPDRSDWPDSAIRSYLKKMAKAGILGIAIDIRWDRCQTAADRYTFPEVYDRVITIAGEEGLYATILLAGHYTPRFLLEGGLDIAMYDIDGHPSSHTFMPYSWDSPAFDLMKQWIGQATAHYSAHKNLLAIWLSNEVAYTQSAIATWNDYSAWSRDAFNDFKKQHGYGGTNALPRDHDDPQWLLWMQYRQLHLIDKLNELYETAAAKRRPGILLSHKIAYYEATAAHSPMVGLHPAPTHLLQDVVAANIYGDTEHVYALLRSFNKPIFITETNVAGGTLLRDQLRQALLRNFEEGAYVQTIFRWNYDFDHYALFHKNGYARASYSGLLDAIKVIKKTKLKRSDDHRAAIVIPWNFSLLKGAEYWNYQHLLEELTNELQGRGYSVSLLYSDALSYDLYPQLFDHGTGGLGKFDVVFALEDFGLDAGWWRSSTIKHFLSDPKKNLYIVEKGSEVTPYIEAELQKLRR